MAMSDRSSKRARILALSRQGNNGSALDRELRILREDPSLLDDVRSRRTVHRSLDKLWEQLGQRHSLQIDPGEDDDSDGEDTFTWCTLSLRSVFELLVAESEEFRAQPAQLYSRRPCTPDAPWDIIFNFDEADVVPTEYLSPTHLFKKDHRFPRAYQQRIVGGEMPGEHVQTSLRTL